MHTSQDPIVISQGDVPALRSGTQGQTMKDKYKYIGPIYDFLSNVYSGKSIQDCRTAMLTPAHIKPGDKVLFAGVGIGRDAIRAAELGAQVTVVDLSSTMLRNFSKVLSEEAPHLSIRQVHEDILKVSETGQYDMVVANFFLNVFDEALMMTILRHLVTLGRPGAKLVIGDFSFPTGNLIARSLKKVYWHLAAFVFWVLARNALHPIYNYPAIMQELGLKVREKKYYVRLGMNTFWSILAEKPAQPTIETSAV